MAETSEARGFARWLVSLLVLPGLFLVACEEENLPPESATYENLALAPTEIWLPTPTLAAGLPTPPPPPPTLAPGVTPDTPTPTSTATPSPSPTATPPAAERIEHGLAELNYGNLDSAAAQFEASLAVPEALSRDEEEESLYELGITYLEDGQYGPAVATFNQLLGITSGGARSETYFHLGRANLAIGEYETAVNAFQTYLVTNPEMSPYVSPYIADAYFALGDRDNAITAYEAALSGLVYPPMLFDIRQHLAEFYLENGEYEAAAAQYQLLADLSSQETTGGRMTYLAGNATILAGNVDVGHALYLEAIAQYPRAYESYLGLVELVEAGVPVDEFQRGIVDFYARMYDPAIAALERHTVENPDTYNQQAHLYLAWSYEALDNRELALAQLDAYAASSPADAAIERAKLLQRGGDLIAAANAYQSYLDEFPDGEQAPFASWWTAALTERSGDVIGAIQLYRRLADNYSWHEDAPEALFHAGWLAYGQDELADAVRDWQKSASAYPESHFGAASLFWLLKTQEEYSAISGEDGGQDDAGGAYPVEESTVDPGAKTTPTPDLSQLIADLVTDNRGVSYFALRAKDIISDVAPFTPPDALVSFDVQFPADESERWLRTWLDVEGDINVSDLAPELAGDPRLIVGTKLWNLGLREEAKLELESLRRDYLTDGLSSFQLAHYFRDLGLYRSSILAAETVLRLSGQTVLEAPVGIGHLAYPVYYADLILPLAEQYGYDPLLQFALVRQESLFESFAKSGAAAQGLAQVIPDTGAYIAQLLEWPDYENEDLFKPYVGLAFGAYYLDQQLRSFGEQVHAALAAYNAGPGNAARWYEIASDDHDAFVETVDFAETRLYIERIYTGHVIYKHLYGR